MLLQKSCLDYQAINDVTVLPIETMKGLDTVESLSAGAAWLKVRYPRKNIGIISIAQKMCWVLS